MADEIPEPRLGPYRGPVVVAALAAVVVVGALLIALVGAVRAPDDVSNSATVLGTFPIDPEAEGIPEGPAGSDQPAGSTIPGGGPQTSGPSTVTSTTPPDTQPAGDPDVLDAFDGDLGGWEPVDGEWAVADGELVVPEGSDETPAFLLRADDASAIGGEVGTPARAAGLVVGYADPGTYAAALSVPALGGWRLEVHVDGEEVANASVPASTAAGTVVALVLRSDGVALVVDGADAGVIAAPEGLGDRAGFIGRGPAGGTWAAAVEGPTG